jgi:phenylalanine-4-hydroxylase
MDTSAATDAVYEENTSNLSTSKQNTDPNPTQKSESEQPLWKANLSRRWSKKQPTKGELCDTFLDMKHSLTVQSNNIIGLNKRIERLEQDLADLIRYVNERL